MTEVEPTTALARREPDTLDIAVLLNTAVDKGLDPDALSKLVELRDRMLAKRSESEAMAEFAAMQATMTPVPKTRIVPDKSGKAKYLYAALEDVMDHLRPWLQRHGFVVRFNSALESESFPGSTGQLVRQFQQVECIVTHVGGHSWSASHRSPLDPNAPGNPSQSQIGASSETYAKRRALMNVFGLVAENEDDDGRSSRQPDRNDAPDADASAPKVQPRGKREETVTPTQLNNCYLHWKKVLGAFESDGGSKAGWMVWVTKTCGLTTPDSPETWTAGFLSSCRKALEMEEQRQ